MKPCRPHHGDYKTGCPVCVRARRSERDALRMGEPWPPPDLPPGMDSPPPPRDPKTWPRLVRWIWRLRGDTDRGVGDTINRKLGGAGEAFKTWYHRLTGSDCGCADRQADLNRRYPYS